MKLLQSEFRIQALPCGKKIAFIPKACSHGATTSCRARSTSALQVHFVLCDKFSQEITHSKRQRLPLLIHTLPYPTGLGSLRDLDDQLLLQILQLVDARTLTLCSAASRALYCFCMHDELWRALTLQASLPIPSHASHPANVLAAQ